MGVKKCEYILLGDSSGGNLACSLLNFIISNGLKKPISVILNYPAININIYRYTKSLMYSIEDAILSFTTLLFSSLGYQEKDDDCVNNPYISPIKTPDSILQQYPPVFLLYGTKDPLCDDSQRLLDRLLVNRVECLGFKYVGYPHGVLNLCIPMGL